MLDRCEDIGIDFVRICPTKYGIAAVAGRTAGRGQWEGRGARLDHRAGTKSRSQGGTAERTGLSFVDRPTNNTMVSRQVIVKVKCAK